MLSRLHRLVVLFVLVLLLGACVAQEMAVPSPISVPLTATQASVETVVSSTATPAVMPTATSTSVPTATATERPTVPPTATSTSRPPVLTVGQNAVCRTGPGTNFPIAGYLSAGAQPVVGGVAVTEMTWWYITLSEGETCFLAETVASLDGDAAALPQVTPPPTPTPKAGTSLVGGGIYYFLATTGTGGPFGCGDNLYYVFTGAERTGDLETDIFRALDALFSDREQYSHGLYNPIYASSLRVTDVDVIPGASEINVYVAGTFVRPKDKCESKLMRDQIWGTIETQFPEVGHAVIWIGGGTLLGDLLVVNK